MSNTIQSRFLTSHCTEMNDTPASLSPPCPQFVLRAVGPQRDDVAAALGAVPNRAPRYVQRTGGRDRQGALIYILFIGFHKYFLWPFYGRPRPARRVGGAFSWAAEGAASLSGCGMPTLVMHSWVICGARICQQWTGTSSARCDVFERSHKSALPVPIPNVLNPIS